MDATINEVFPLITDGTLTASLNSEGTHVYVTRAGHMGRRGPRAIVVGWVELPTELREAVSEWERLDRLARYGSDSWADAADAWQDGLCESILEWLAR